MAWQDQGRQYHQWFGHGTAADGGSPEAKDTAVKIAYSALGSLPPPVRTAYEGWINRGGLQQLAAVLPAWVAGSSLPEAEFHRSIFGEVGRQSFSQLAQAVGQALVASTDSSSIKVAGERFAALAIAARLGSLGHVMAAAVQQSTTPEVRALVRNGAAGIKASMPPAPRPLTPAELRSKNIADLAKVLYNEARGEGEAGMTAVGYTLANRMSRNGHTAVTEDWGAYSHTEPNPKKPEDLAAYELAKQVAASVLDRTAADPTAGATHYYSPTRMPKEGNPTAKFDVKGGLETVPGVVDRATGVPVRNYRPGFGSNPQFIQQNVPGIEDRSFKFYRRVDVPGLVK